MGHGPLPTSDPAPRARRRVMPGRGDRIGPYTVERLLGQGGMADVFMATDPQGDEVAVKVCGTGDDVLLGRLFREARVHRLVEHPNVVRVIELVQHRGVPALVMEYVNGDTLEHLLGERIAEDPARGPLDVEAALHLFHQLAQAVAAVHRAGLVHRDLKPANVLLARSDDGGLTVKLADFGLAKEVGGERDEELLDLVHTRTGIAMGTPRYMSPEQIRDAKAVDTRSDMFSLGCILYELLTGLPAFEGSDVITIFGNIGAGRHSDLALLPPSLPVHAADAIRGCLDPDAARRIPSVEVLLEVLEEGATAWPSAASAGAPSGAANPTILPDAGETMYAEDFSAVVARPHEPAPGRGGGAYVMGALGAMAAVAALALALALTVFLAVPSRDAAVPVAAPATVAVEPAAPTPVEVEPAAAPEAEVVPPAPEGIEVAQPTPEPAPARSVQAASPLRGLWVGSITIDIVEHRGRRVRAVVDAGTRLELSGTTDASATRVELSDADSGASLVAYRSDNHRGGANLEGELRHSRTAPPEPFVVVRR